MNPVFDALLSSWPFDPGLLAGLGVTGGIYLRGWLVLHRRLPQRWQVRQPAAFLGGLATIYLALASPIEPFSFLYLQVHMVQHLLLMMAAPPLLWLGDPLFPFLHGLPEAIRRYWVAPLFRLPRLRHFLAVLTHPAAAWLLFVAAAWVWHVPALYEIAIGSNGWHYVQHLVFLGTGLVFWYPVVRPYPSRPRWPRWLLLPYLLLADVQNTVLAALLTFADRVVYPHYAQMPRLEGLAALEDQATAGVIMWVPGSLAFLAPLFWIGTRMLFGSESSTPRRSPKRVIADSGFEDSAPATPISKRIALPVLTDRPKPAEHWDLLRLPLLGRFLHWRHARLSLQIPLLLLAVALIYDGLTGPSVAPMNLAGVLPWIHWRGLLILGLLVVGNVFCLACPFQVPRTLARRFFTPQYLWPRRLRNKWLAVLLLVLFLWAYEAFALWDSPWWTAWIAVGYFAAALAVDSCFRGAVFCKYVCPIGQFNFVQSLLSPWEVRARDPAVCASCQTKDCIRGAPSPLPLSLQGRGEARGCELHLFVPRKSSNLDCTLCLDCIHACPHDNIGIVSGTPAAELWHDPPRSGLGRLSKRPDLAALVLVLVFGSFANAAGMVAPVADGQVWLSTQWGQQTPFWSVSAYYLFALLVLPLLLAGSAAWLSRRWGGLSASWLEAGTRQVYALAPLGFAMWLTHYSFHLLTSYETAIPAIQRLAGLGAPDWSCSCCRPVMDWLPRLEILILQAGVLLSLYTSYRIALHGTSDLPRTLRALAPWAAVIVALFAVGVWIVLQPMQMRGTLELAG